MGTAGIDKLQIFNYQITMERVDSPCKILELVSKANEVTNVYSFLISVRLHARVQQTENDHNADYNFNLTIQIVL